jgi:hypothetical protein
MLRLLSQEVLLFLLPFGAYALLLVARQRLPFMREPWTGQAALVLATIGLMLAVVGLVALGLLGPRHRGAYQPAHIEKGRLVPGHME